MGKIIALFIGLIFTVAAQAEVYEYKTIATDFFALGKPSMLKIHGVAKNGAGSLTKQDAKFSGTFNVTLTTFDTGMKLRDSHLRSKVFEVEKYPTSEFTLEPVSILNAESTSFKGKLKFHGVEKEIQGQVTLAQKEKLPEFKATFSILLTDFGVQPPEFAGMSIQNEVRVEVSSQ